MIEGDNPPWLRTLVLEALHKLIATPHFVQNLFKRFDESGIPSLLLLLLIFIL